MGRVIKIPPGSSLTLTPELLHTARAEHPKLQDPNEGEKLERKLKAESSTFSSKCKKSSIFTVGLSTENITVIQNANSIPSRPKGPFPPFCLRNSSRQATGMHLELPENQALLGAAGDAEKNTWSQPAKTSV